MQAMSQAAILRCFVGVVVKFGGPGMAITARHRTATRRHG
jgi:hypothetical protein